MHSYTHAYIKMHTYSYKLQGSNASIVCCLIKEMDTQHVFAAGMYTTLDIYEKCRPTCIIVNNRSYNCVNTFPIIK